MIKIKLVDDQIDRIIIDELKNDYRINLGPNQIDCSDDTIAGNQSLLDTIKCVLRLLSCHTSAAPLALLRLSQMWLRQL